jgi:hypothetical protein
VPPRAFTEGFSERLLQHLTQEDCLKLSSSLGGGDLAVDTLQAAYRHLRLDARARIKLSDRLNFHKDMQLT